MEAAARGRPLIVFVWVDEHDAPSDIAAKIEAQRAAARDERLARCPTGAMATRGQEAGRRPGFLK
jgi:hypothetical protein